MLLLQRLFGPPNIQKLLAKRNIKGLIKALSYQQHCTVRRNAAEALGVIGDARAVESLAGMLRDEDLDARNAAVKALGAICDSHAGWLPAVSVTDAVKPLFAMLRDDDLDVRMAAVKVLGAIGDSYVVDGLDAVNATSTLNLLIAMLQGGNLDVRSATVKALSKIFAPSDFVNPLIAMLRNDDSRIRSSAVEALRAIGDTDAVKSIIAKFERSEYLHVNNPGVHAALFTQVSKAVSALHNFVKANIRIYAVEALGAIGDADTVIPLISMLQDDDSKIRSSAVEALRAISDTDAVKPNIAALGNDDSGVGSAAVEAILKQTSEAVNALVMFIEVLSTRQIMDFHDELYERKRRIKQLMIDTDEIYTAEDIWIGKSEDSCREAKSRMTAISQPLFAKIAVTDTSANLGVFAVEKLNDERLLAEIAEKTKHSEVRKIAIGKITDERLLAEIAEKTKYSEIRKVAMEKITNQVLLIDIAMTHTSVQMCELALRNLTDQVLLAEVARFAKVCSLSMIAVEKLTDKVILAEIAEKANRSEVQRAAAKKLGCSF